MRRHMGGATGLILASILLVGCATQSAGDPSGAVGPNLAEWENLSGASVFSATPAHDYSSLRELIEASEVVVLARLTDQRPIHDHDIIATDSVMEVLEVLKGPAEQGDVRVYTIGTPSYVPGHVRIDGAADPPLFDEMYLLPLQAMPELVNSEGELVPIDNLWRATGYAHYIAEEDGSFNWDGGLEVGGMPSTTIDEVRAIIGGG